MGSYAAILALGLLLQGQSPSTRSSPTQAVDSRARELAERQAARERSVRVELAKPFDAKKAKPGDLVTTELMENLEFNNAVLAPRGSKIRGRVVEVQRSAGKSAVSLAFDRAIVNGTQVPLVATVKAIGTPIQIYSAHWDSSKTKADQPDLQALSVHGRLADNAQGVWGLPGLTLEEMGPEIAAVRSKNADLKLQTRTQFILRISPR